MAESDLEFLALHENELRGSIGTVTQSLTKLSHLDLSGNWFSGDMGSFEKMSNLRYLFLAFNSAFQRGEIPQSLASLPHLVDISLQMTEREGSIPDGFGLNPNLVYFDMSYNYLGGKLPEDLGSASSLQFLLLNRNEGLTGTIPESYSGLRELSILLLDRTDLIGPSSPICNNKPTSLQNFIADCDEISCPVDCCTKCCEDPDENTVTVCNDEIWNAQLDPVAEYRYKRTGYKFFNQGTHPANHPEDLAPGSPSNEGTVDIPVGQPPADLPAQDPPAAAPPQDQPSVENPVQPPAADNPGQDAPPPAEAPGENPGPVYDAPPQDEPNVNNPPEDNYDQETGQGQPNVDNPGQAPPEDEYDKEGGG